MTETGNIYYVYIYRDPRDKVPFYVGKGKDRRCYNHLIVARSESACNRKYHYPVSNKIRKLWREGVEPLVELIAENLSEESAFDLERVIIAEVGRRKSVGGYGGPLMNILEGGGGHSGYRHSEKTKKLISEMYKGAGNPLYGKKLSKQHRMRISSANKGKTKSLEAVEKARKGLKDRNALMTFEERKLEHANQAKSLRSFYKTKESVKSIQQGRAKRYKDYILISPEGIEFRMHSSLKNICEEFSLSYKRMCEVSGGSREHYHGWKVRRLNT